MRFLRHDWILNGAIIFLIVASLLTVGSVAPTLLAPQILWVIIGILCVAGISRIQVKPLLNYRWVVFSIYFFSVALLIVTVFLAPEVRGVRGWLPIGDFRFQTSEFVKVALLMLLAYFFSKRHNAIAHPMVIIASFLYMILPVAFVFMEPDWGSALVFLGLWAGFLLASGLPTKFLLSGFAVTALLLFFSWNYFLAPYQKERIAGFLDPKYDPLGINYSAIQAKIAIGSAGYFGKGIGRGTQAQLGFLTEPATDFIFSAFIEEWGLVGAFLLLSAFALMMYRILRIGFFAYDNFAKFVCLGTAFVFLIEFFLNVGSNLGLVPVIGVTFPFVSYGGSSMIAKSILLGLVQSLVVHESFAADQGKSMV